MDVILFNFVWMLYNIALGCIAVIFGWLTYRTHRVPLKYLFGIIWILFLPNTIYILTDSAHYFEELVTIQPGYQYLLTIQFALLMISGIATFLFGMYPLEMILRHVKGKRKIIEQDVILIATNCLIAFGMVLGRVQRTNSWDIVFNLPRVITDTLHVLLTPELLLLFFFFAIVCNTVYFPLRTVLRKYETIFYNN